MSEPDDDEELSDEEALEIAVDILASLYPEEPDLREEFWEHIKDLVEQHAGGEDAEAEDDA